MAESPPVAVLVLRVQSAYYGVTGAWPVLHMRSFEAITGPKTDDWLVRMVGLLTVAIAGALWPRGSDGEVAAAVRTLAVTAAASYLAIDVFYAVSGVISPIYLLDAILEIGLITTHALLWPRRSRPVASK